MAAGMPMNVRLDTGALLARAGGAGSLPEQAAAEIERASLVAVGAARVWEIVIKAKTGRLRLESPVLDWYAEPISRYPLDEIPLLASSLRAAAGLPPLHRDPFDRVPAAAALERGWVLLISDRVISTHPGVEGDLMMVLRRTPA